MRIAFALALLLALASAPEARAEEACDLQAVLDAAEPGSTVRIPSCTVADSLRVEKAVTIEGEDGRATVLLAGAEPATWRPALRVQADDVTVRALTLRGWGSAVQAFGLGAPEVRNLTIRDVSFEPAFDDPSPDAFSAPVAVDLHEPVVGLVVRDSAFATPRVLGGLSSSPDGAGERPSVDVLFVNNTFRGCASTGLDLVVDGARLESNRFEQTCGLVPYWSVRGRDLEVHGNAWSGGEHVVHVAGRENTATVAGNAFPEGRVALGGAVDFLCNDAAGRVVVGKGDAFTDVLLEANRFAGPVVVIADGTTVRGNAFSHPKGSAQPAVWITNGTSGVVVEGNDLDEADALDEGDGTAWRGNWWGSDRAGDADGNATDAAPLAAPPTDLDAPCRPADDAPPEDRGIPTPMVAPVATLAAAAALLGRRR